MFVLLTDDATTMVVFFGKNVTYLLRGHECCRDFSTQERRIGGNGPNNVGIHDMDKPLPSIIDIPSNPGIACPQIKYRVG